MSDPVFQGALAKTATIQSAIDISSPDDRGMIDLRGDPGDKKFLAAAKNVFGFALPTEPRHSAGSKEFSALWLSPDQWLITCPRARTSEINARLQAELASLHALAVDVSDARTIIRLCGAGARLVLMKGVPVDLTTPEITDGFVRRVRFAELAALVHVVSIEPELIELYVFRSYAQYAWDWLSTTASEQSALSIFSRQRVAAV